MPKPQRKEISNLTPSAVHSLTPTIMETEPSLKWKGVTTMEQYQIIAIRGHYEVYLNGKFFCSADTFMEAVKEIEKEVG